MKDYWLVIDPDCLSIEICFPDNLMNGINACLATISWDQQEQLLKRLQEITVDTAPFTLSYEYFTLTVSPFVIDYDFHMFEEPVSYYLYTRIFKNALAEYLDEMNKLCNPSV